MKTGSRGGWRGLAILARTAFLVAVALTALASAALLITSFVIWFLGGL